MPRPRGSEESTTMEFGGIADNFFVNLSLQTTLALPTTRETVLHFFEAVRKQFASMATFYQRETGEFVLEGDRDSGSYRWLELQAHRLSAGFFDPPQLNDAYEMHAWLLDRSVYYLGVSGLDVECLDLLFGFNLDFIGNRDDIVAQAALGGSPLSALLMEPPARTCVECEPSFVVALDEECHLQARLHVETHSSSYQVRTGQYEDEPISVYLTVRQYPRPGEVFAPKDSFSRQCELCEEIAAQTVVPNVVQSISAAIAASQ